MAGNPGQSYSIAVISHSDYGGYDKRLTEALPGRGTEALLR